MITLVCFAALVFAAARLTLVATWDKLTFSLRLKISEKGVKNKFFAFLDDMLACVWCAGFHITWLLNIPTMFVMRWEYPHIPWWVSIIIYVNTSFGASFLASKLASGVNNGV